MSFILLGFITGLSLILALGPQNIFVIEQGLKKEFIFVVCLICSFSDLLLIFFGIFLFHHFQIFFTPIIEFILNFLLLIFLLHFISNKISHDVNKLNLNIKRKRKTLSKTLIKTLGFTYLNPHVYSDTVFFFRKFFKRFFVNPKNLFLGRSFTFFIHSFFLAWLHVQVLI